MNNFNPDVLTYDQLQTATQIQIETAQYQFIVASVSLAFSLVFLYFVFKLAIWFFPRYWDKSKGAR